MCLNVKYKFPKSTSPQVIRAKLLNAVKWTNDEQIKLINQYLYTWKHRGQIDVTNRYGYKGGDAFAAINIDDPTGAFWYIEHGTSVRYATMSPDFIAKTAPRRIQSGRGQGKMLFINKNRPRKGIQGRHVLTEINKVTGKSFVIKVKKAISEIQIGLP